MIGLILGNIMVVLGVFSIIKGKLPLIKRYNGVKNIKLHSRIEGTAILLVGIMLIFQCFISLGNVEIVIIILSICIFLHIPQELRIRSRGTERHSASN